MFGRKRRDALQKRLQRLEAETSMLDSMSERIHYAEQLAAADYDVVKKECRVLWAALQIDSNTQLTKRYAFVARIAVAKGWARENKKKAVSWYVPSTVPFGLGHSKYAYALIWS